MTIRILVTGSREWTDRETLEHELADTCDSLIGPVIVVETHRTWCGAMRMQHCTCTPTRERFYRDGRIVEEPK